MPPSRLITERITPECETTSARAGRRSTATVAWRAISDMLASTRATTVSNVSKSAGRR